MSKLWYPVAISVTMVSCGADTDSSGSGPATGGSTQVDTGVPAQTGGLGKAYYGVIMPTGGFSSADTGTPSETGGVGIMPPYGIIPTYGGASSASTAAGAPAAGGAASVDGGAPAATGGNLPVIYGAIGVYGLRGWLDRK